MATVNKEQTKQETQPETDESVGKKSLTPSTPNVRPAKTYPYEVSNILTVVRRQKEPTLPEQEMDTNSAEDYMNYIGPSFVGNSTTRLGRTIFDYADNPFDEEKRIMARIIKIDPRSEKWEEKLDEYWDNLYVFVPYSDLPLEIGKRYLSADEWIPINPSEFIIGLYCLKYGVVANNPDDMHKAKRIKFYLWTAEKEREQKLTALKLEEQAFNLRKQHENDLNTTNAILRLGRRKLVKNVLDGQIALLDFQKEAPKRFIELAADKNLIQKDYIERAIASNILQRPDNSTIIVYDSVTIGHNLDQAIAWLNDPLNGQAKAVIESRLNPRV